MRRIEQAYRLLKSSVLDYVLNHASDFQAGCDGTRLAIAHRGPRLSIMARILLVVLLLEMTGYSFLLLYSSNSYEKDLVALREKQIEAIFDGNSIRINAITGLMERNVKDLANAGERLYRLKQEHPARDLESLFRALLVENFRTFPQSIGGGIWFEPYRYDPGLKYYGPYAFRGPEGVQFSWDLNTPEYDYHNQDWYRLAAKNDSSAGGACFPEICWTAPYWDEAGSHALMMTVDALMRDENGAVIGLATVDWAMTEMTRFIEKIRVTEHSFPFLIELSSRRFVSYPRSPRQVMQHIDTLGWASAVADTAETGRVKQISGVMIENVEHRIEYVKTDIGLVFGMMIPVVEITREVDQIRRASLFNGVLISLFFIICVLVTLELLFRPFSRVLQLIRDSIRHEGGRLEVTPLEYNHRNEFTPIVTALNTVYEHVNQYTREVRDANLRLRESRDEVGELNLTLEAKVAERTRELEARTAEALAALEQVRRMQDQLVEAEKMSALGNLVAGIAHEINTPIGVGMMASTSLQSRIRRLRGQFDGDGPDAGQLEKFLADSEEGLDILVSNLQRAAELVRSFKQVAVDQTSEERRQINLADYLNEVLVSLRPKLKVGGHQASVEGPGDLVLQTYPGAISQVIANLVINSVQHGFKDRREGRIRIELEREEDTIRIRYSDDGSGIPPDVLDHVYDPFFTTDRQQGGTGLGMHVVYNLVTRRLGGHLHADSREGEGTSFTIEFPANIPGDSEDRDAFMHR